MWSSWRSFDVIIGRLGGRFARVGGVLGASLGDFGVPWGVLGGHFGDLGSSWALSTAVDALRGIPPDFRSRLGSIFGPILGPKRDPKRSPRRPQIDQKIVLKNDRVLERS